MRALQATARLALSKMVKCWAPPPASVPTLVSALPPAGTSMTSRPPPPPQPFSSSQGLQFFPVRGWLKACGSVELLTYAEGKAEADLREPHFLPALRFPSHPPTSPLEFRARGLRCSPCTDGPVEAQQGFVISPSHNLPRPLL